jgi:hypothetical protein
MHLDNSNVTMLIGHKHPFDREGSTVGELDDCGASALDDVVVGHHPPILAYEEAATLGDRVPFLVRHDN